jgi:hypothetical protein
MARIYKALDPVPAPKINVDAKRDDVGNTAKLKAPDSPSIHGHTE